MRDSADMDGMPDVKSRRAFFSGEIVYQDQPLEMKLEFTPNFPHSEMRAVCGLFCGMTFGCIFSLPFLGTSSVAAFLGPNPDTRNRVCFAVSRQPNEIIAAEAPHSHTVFLSIRQDAFWINELRRSCAKASSEGERCMKDTDHPTRHPLVHPWILGSVRRRRSCGWHDDQFGRRQNTGLGWSDPTFVHVSVPKVIRGVAPAQLRGDRAEYFVRVSIAQSGRPQ